MFGQFRRCSSQKKAWNRSDSNSDDLREYDAFGPWLLLVKSASEMPRRFRSAYDGVKDAEYLLKIPRSLDRRDAYPGGDLYGAVLALDADGLTLLTAADADDDFVERWAGWDEVSAVRTVNNLVRAEFVLLLKEGDELTISYNAVSAELMGRVVTFARQRLKARQDFDVAFIGDGEEFGDFFFSGMLAEERYGDHFVRPVYFEAPGKPCLDSQGRRRITTGILILLSESELVIVDRSIPMRRRFFSHYIYRKTYVCLASIRAFRLLAPVDGAPGHFTFLELIMDQQRLSVPCFNPPTRLVTILLHFGIRQL